MENPVSSNFQEVKEMNEIMLQLFMKKKYKAVINQDGIYKQNRRKNLDVMGLLCKLWYGLEGPTRHGESSSLSIEDLLRTVQQTVLLLGQTNFALPYHGRDCALNGIMSNTSHTK